VSLDSPFAPPSDARSPDVSILIATCDRRELLEDCLASLASLDLDGVRAEVVVFDNGSRDGTAEWLAARHPAARVVASPVNVGFAAANDRAAEAARAPLLCLVNNDMRFDRRFLRELLAAHRATGAACVGATILSADGSCLEFDGGAMSFDGHAVPLRHGAPLGEGETRRAPFATLFACGGAMLVARDVFLRAGGFDEDYFAYFEDVDLGWRLWVLGERCVQAPGALCYHREHGSESLLAAGRRLELLEQNALLTIYKNYEPERGERVLRCALALLAERVRCEPGRAAACERGLLGALRALPAAERRRREIAERRRRGDAEIAPLFREPWRPPIAGDAYAARQRELAALFGAADLFSAEGLAPQGALVEVGRRR
jgi:GT2 family glycosyltransferase